MARTSGLAEVKGQQLKKISLAKLSTWVLVLCLYCRPSGNQCFFFLLVFSLSLKAYTSYSIDDLLMTTLFLTYRKNTFWKIILTCICLLMYFLYLLSSAEHIMPTLTLISLIFNSFLQLQCKIILVKRHLANITSDTVPVWCWIQHKQKWCTIPAHAMTNVS